MIDQAGAVWWGWWKKIFEADQWSAIKALQGDRSVIVLVDRSTGRSFHAECRDVSNRLGDSELARVPEYYRFNASKVAAWFRLVAIADTAYAADVAERMGESTLLWLDGARSTELAAAVPQATSFLERSAVLHLSDLHFGADYAFRPPGDPGNIGEQPLSLTDCLQADLDRLRMTNEVGIVLVTGDFTTRGDWSDKTMRQVLDEFECLRSRLGLTQKEVVPIPGNHDIVRYPEGSPIDAAAIAVERQTDYEHERNFRVFSEKITGRHWSEPLDSVRVFSLRDVDVVICALNSCRIVATKWTEYGYVGDGGLAILKELGALSRTRPTYQLMALHHHLAPVSRVDAPSANGVSLTLDAVSILDAAQAAGVQVTLHGHQHRPRVIQYRHLPLLGEVSGGGGMFIVSGGSSGVTSARRPGDERNTYSLLQLRGDGARLWIRELRNDGKAGAPLFEEELRIQPTSSPS